MRLRRVATPAPLMMTFRPFTRLCEALPRTPIPAIRSGLQKNLKIRGYPGDQQESCRRHCEHALVPATYDPETKLVFLQGDAKALRRPGHSDRGRNGQWKEDRSPVVVPRRLQGSQRGQPGQRGFLELLAEPTAGARHPLNSRRAIGGGDAFAHFSNFFA